MMTNTPGLQTGIDLALQSALQPGQRYALVTNDVAYTSQGLPSRLALIEKGFQLVRLFSPEHGLQASGADGAWQPDLSDTLTGLPVRSLYGDHLWPQAADLEDVDAVLFDIPDVGCRFYTYLWTMSFVMESCAAVQKPLIILDRPNPISGLMELAEGPLLDEWHCSSFTGRWSIPIRHSATLGELALYFKATKLPDLLLEVIPCTGWKRDRIVSKENFRPTSPAIRDPVTALLYPGMGLLEGIRVNEGRGTRTPFQLMGAPWINAEELSAGFNALELPGVLSHPVRYTPEESVFMHEVCEGIRMEITDPYGFKPVHTGMELIRLLFALYPSFAAERNYPTRVNPNGSGHLDKLVGVPGALERILHAEELTGAEAWASTIAPYLLYH